MSFIPQISPPEAGEAALRVPADQIPDALEWTTAYLETLLYRAGNLGLPVTSKFNSRIALKIIRDLHGMPDTACCADIVAKVRETKAVADLSGAALAAKQEPLAQGSSQDPGI